MHVAHALRVDTEKGWFYKLMNFNLMRAGRVALRGTSPVLILFLIAGCAVTPKANFIAPTALPGVRQEMKTAGFWIGRVPEPDKLILSAEQIEGFNKKIREKELILDLGKLGEDYDGFALRKALSSGFSYFQQRRYYLAGGAVVPRSCWDEWHKLMAVDAIPNRPKVRFGFTMCYADQRLLPTERLVSLKPGDLDFDELQNSSFDPGVPLAIVHESADGRWCYALAASSEGWMLKDSIVFCSREQFMAYFQRPNFAVVTAAKADLYLDRGLTRPYAYCRMGARFPLVNAGEVAELRAPGKDAAGSFVEQPVYISGSEIHDGYLAYTQRTVLSQAFRLLNAPYGWGGMHGEQDCSSFVQEIFSVCGFVLPRNSGAQVKVGREAVSACAVPALSLLGMPGHIMLYLGDVDNRPYAIHAVWAYRVPGTREDVPMVINRVAVTGLLLGEGSAKGSWRKRINHVRVIDQE